MKIPLTPILSGPSREARLPSGCAVVLAGILVWGGVAQSIEATNNHTEVRAFRLVSLVVPGAAAGVISGVSAGFTESFVLPHVGSRQAEVPVANQSGSDTSTVAGTQQAATQQPKSVGYIYPFTEMVGFLLRPLMRLVQIPGLDTVFGPILLGAAIILGGFALGVDGWINELIDKWGWRGAAPAAGRVAGGIVPSVGESREPSDPSGTVVVAVPGDPGATDVEGDDLASPPKGRTTRAVTGTETLEAKRLSTQPGVDLSTAPNGFADAVKLADGDVTETPASAGEGSTGTGGSSSSSGNVVEGVDNANNSMVSDSHPIADPINATESDFTFSRASKPSIGEQATAVHGRGRLHTSGPSRDRRGATDSSRPSHGSDSER